MPDFMEGGEFFRKDGMDGSERGGEGAPPSFVCWLLCSGEGRSGDTGVKRTDRVSGADHRCMSASQPGASKKLDRARGNET